MLFHCPQNLQHFISPLPPLQHLLYPVHVPGFIDLQVLDKQETAASHLHKSGILHIKKAHDGTRWG